MEYHQSELISAKEISGIHFQLWRGSEICLDERILSRAVRRDEEIHRRRTLAHCRKQLGSQRCIGSFRRSLHPQHHARTDVLPARVWKRRNGHLPAGLLRIRMDTSYHCRTLRTDWFFFTETGLAQSSLLWKKQTSIYYRPLEGYRWQTGNVSPRVRLRTQMEQRRPLEEQISGRIGQTYSAEYGLSLLWNRRYRRFTDIGFGTFCRARNQGRRTGGSDQRHQRSVV